MRLSVLLQCLLLASCCFSAASSLKISVMDSCVNPLLPTQQLMQQQQQQGIALEITASEFYSSFASIFQLSDGSRISIPEAQGRKESLKYMQVIILFATMFSHCTQKHTHTHTHTQNHRSSSTPLASTWTRGPATSLRSRRKTVMSSRSAGTTWSTCCCSRRWATLLQVMLSTV